MSLIDTNAAFDDALDALEGARLFAVDTEFHWERSYEPLLAVVQVAGRDPEGRIHAFAFDALELELEPLLELLAEESRLKVLHAGRIDLQIFTRLLDEPLRPVFDTQLAGALLGFGHQVGYAGIVEAVTGVKLGKKHQYSDWTRRPLTEGQVEYALKDVLHLLDVYEGLAKLLLDTKRLDWASQEMAHLTDPSTYVEPGDEERYLKVKARHGLDRRGLSVLRELAAWREQEARKRDVRPTFVLKDMTLLDLARRQPRSLGEVKASRNLHPAEARKSGEPILKAIKRGLARKDLPELPPRSRKRKVDVSAAVGLMKAYLGQVSEQRDVAAEVIATSADLESLAKARARGEDPVQLPVLQGWRGELVGRDLLRILDGEVTLGLDPDGDGLRLIEREDEDSGNGAGRPPIHPTPSFGKGRGRQGGRSRKR